MGVKSQEDPF